MNRKRQDGLVIGAIHLFTWATVLLLLLILSYVTFRGIWKRTIVENEMQVGPTKSYVVGSNLGDELTWSDLQRIVKGRVTTWTYPLRWWWTIR